MFARLRYSLKLANHTSLLVVPLVCLVLLLVAQPAQAFDLSLSDGVDLKGVVTGVPPIAAAVIESPTDRSTVTAATVTVSGRCQGDVVVEIYKNAIFAGSTTCENGRFSLSIELVVGINNLMARVISKAGQYGPDSSPVTVVFIPSEARSKTDFLVTTSTPTKAVKTGQDLDLYLLIVGGTAPYSVSIDWGDGTASPVPRDGPGNFVVSHRYKSSGVYTIRVVVTDTTGRQASLQLITLVNGSRIIIDAGSSTEDKPLDSQVSPTLPLIWPLYLFFLTLLAGFWLSRHYKKYHS